MVKRGLLLTGLALLLASALSVSACGGLFCTTSPVDQQTERIIFTMNGDGTISAYVQINYTGSTDAFSWVVPVPTVPEVDVAEIESFTELEVLTAPIIFSPSIPPDCMPIPSFAAGEADTAVMEDDVQVLASGTAGPYAYDVITSPNPQVMIDWLRDNGYQVTEPMEPLIAVYNEEGMVFLAMKLQPEMGVQDIQPVKMTYESSQPMIPLRLTAVAANPNMEVITWVFGDAQAVPENWAHPELDPSVIRGAPFARGGTTYYSDVDLLVDQYDGRAFITEYAQPTGVFVDQPISDPLVLELAQNYDYVTRLYGMISPEQMTVDPVIGFTDDAPDVSNIIDLSSADPRVFWCGE